MNPVATASAEVAVGNLRTAMDAIELTMLTLNPPSLQRLEKTSMDADAVSEEIARTVEAGDGTPAFKRLAEARHIVEEMGEGAWLNTPEGGPSIN